MGLGSVTTNYYSPYDTSPANGRVEQINIVITGLNGSGMNTFIKTISHHVQLKGDGPNQWLHGWVPADENLVVHFRKPPSPPAYDFMWMRTLMKNTRAADGFIVMLDSTRPKYFGEFLSILYTIHGYHPNVPIVAAANKQDKRNAWHARDIQLGLSISEDIPVVPCMASNRESVKNVLLWLLYRVWGIAPE